MHRTIKATWDHPWRTLGALFVLGVGLFIRLCMDIAAIERSYDMRGNHQRYYSQVK